MCFRSTERPSHLRYAVRTSGRVTDPVQQCIAFPAPLQSLQRAPQIWEGGLLKLIPEVYS